MIRWMKLFALGILAVVLLAIINVINPDVKSEDENSPLFTHSLNYSKERLSGNKADIHKSVTQPAKNNEELTSQNSCWGYQTCVGPGTICADETCEPSCYPTAYGSTGGCETCQVTCQSTCLYQTAGCLTCASTCWGSQTCEGYQTCQQTCFGFTNDCPTCYESCFGTCSGQTSGCPTCEPTCSGVTCGEPIGLSSFNAQCVDGNIVLHWTTASEIDNYSFKIYRSTDAEGEFSVLAEILAQGNGASNTTYTYTDIDVWPGISYYYMLADISLDGSETLHPGVVNATPLMGDKTYMSNFPNPFNETTTIRLVIPVPSRVKLDIYDVRGRLVSQLIDDWKSAGVHEITWNARDNAGNPLPSGMYFYHMTAGESSTNGKMILLK